MRAPPRTLGQLGVNNSAKLSVELAAKQPLIRIANCRFEFAGPGTRLRRRTDNLGQRPVMKLIGFANNCGIIGKVGRRQATDDDRASAWTAMGLRHPPSLVATDFGYHLRILSPSSLPKVMAGISAMPPQKDRPDVAPRPSDSPAA